MKVNQSLIGVLLVFLCTTLSAQSNWQFSSGGNGDWQDFPVSSGWNFLVHRFHDFDGDGHTDVFTVKNGQWLYSSGGKTGWKTLNSAFVDQNIPPHLLRFGDFDGDGKTDVFLEQAGYWGYVSGGKGTFIRLQKAETSIDKIGFGDFNGDGETDIFWSGHPWKYSADGVGEWIKLPVGSGWNFSAFDFYDFDGDERTDVFVVKNGQWLYSSAGLKTWQTLNTSFASFNITHKDLRFGDFDNDGKTDVFLELDGHYCYVSGGSGKAVKLRPADTPLSKLGFGDFDGDGRTDIFRQQ